MNFDPIEEIILDVQAGIPVVIVDDDDRENEGDLMVAAEKITPELISLMNNESKGLICVTLTPEVLDRLQIPMQVADNTTVFGTNFTVSVDHRSVMFSGVSSVARATTILALVDESSKPSDFVSPGFMFPLRAQPGGVFQRRGQTEGSVDLARASGLKPAGVICEIMASDGEMIRGEELEQYCRDNKFKVTSVEKIKEYRLATEVCLRRVAETDVSNILGSIDSIATHKNSLAENLEKSFSAGLKALVYVDDVDNREHLAFVKGTPSNGSLVRIHSECLTGDIFESQRCDCGQQLMQSLSSVCVADDGVVIYLSQEGRDIGLSNKLKAYELQDQGLDTVDANLALGFAADERSYRAGAQILKDLGLNEVCLITNNPDKVNALERLGVKVRGRIELPLAVGEQNTGYLKAKQTKLGHLISV